jgi:hypothetical protein
VEDNRLEHAVGIGEDFVVPEAQNAISLGREQCSTPRIAVALDRMLTAVELDDQATLGTAEVDDERPDRMLTPDLDAHESPITQTRPQATLRVRLRPT